MKLSMKKMAAVGMAMAFWVAQAVPVFAMDPILPHEQVKEGMTGTAYTVIDSSGTRRSFGVDIVGTMDNGKGSESMIMAKAYGPVIEQTGGILQGMSGSPVYVNGYLVGAVAAGIKEMTPYTFFITPIDAMTPLWKLPDRKNKTQLHTVNIKNAAVAEELQKVSEDLKLAEHKADPDKVYGDELIARAQEAVAADKKAKKAEAKKAKEATDAVIKDEASGDDETKNQDSQSQESNKDESATEAATPETADTEKDTAEDTADTTEDDTTEAADEEIDADNVDNAENETEEVSETKSATEKKAVKAEKKAKKQKKVPTKKVAEKPAQNKDDIKEQAKHAAKEAAGAEDAEEKTAEKADDKDVMYFSGFNQSSLDFLKQQIDPQGSTQFLPMGTTGESGMQATDYHASLNPGDAVGVALTYGDFAVGATGTVTAVDGNKMLAFGHPFLHRGNVNYFMTDAQVVGTISGVSNGMKIANIGNIIGRVNQDRETGIAGIVGQFPSVVPIRVHVKDSSLGRDDEFGARIAYDEDLLPQLSGGIAYAALSKTADDLSGSTAKVAFQIRTDAIKGGVVKRDNMFYNTADVGQIAMAELIQAMNAICENSDRESNIVDINVDINVDNERKTASILSAVPDKMEVKPGETVKFTTTLKPYRKAKETVIIPFTVPENQPEGQMALDIRGGGLVPATTLMVLQQAGVDVANETANTQTTEEKLKGLEESGRNNEIIIAPGAANLKLGKMAHGMSKSQPAAPEEHKVDLLEQGKKNEGQTKFATNYIIDNVVHSVLKVTRK